MKEPKKIAELECPFCRKIPYKDNKEYIQWLEEKADYKEANSKAMMDLGLHSYNGSMGIPMNKENATKMWSHAAGTLNNVNSCMNMASSLQDGWK